MPGWKNYNDQETVVPRHHGVLIEASLSLLKYKAATVSKGWKGALKWAPNMLITVSLSDTWLWAKWSEGVENVLAVRTIRSFCM